MARSEAPVNAAFSESMFHEISFNVILRLLLSVIPLSKLSLQDKLTHNSLNIGLEVNQGHRTVSCPVLTDQKLPLRVMLLTVIAYRCIAKIGITINTSVPASVICTDIDTFITSAVFTLVPVPF